MPRILWCSPTSDDPVASEIRAGSALLVGRKPDTRRAPPAAPSARPAAKECLKLDSTLASENHALVWREGDAVVVQDLHSRNGTTIRVPSGGAVSVRDIPEDGLVTASIGGAATPTGELRDIEWSGEEGFRRGVEREISRWLSRNGLDASASVRRAGAAATTTATPATTTTTTAGAADTQGPIRPLPLTAGWEVRIAPRNAGRTALEGWSRARKTLAEYVHRQRQRWQNEEGHGPSLILASAGLRAAHERVVEAAQRGQRVILHGETGSGKGMLASCYANHSNRRGKPFVSINCALLEREMAHATLFGARRGAFTSCDADIEGVVERAHRGVLFLDEIAELGLELQAKLLTFLDGHVYQRLGDPTPRTADVMILCGSTKDLSVLVGRGELREELWYRLAVRTIEVPPLRERREDIEAFLSRRTLGPGEDALTAAEALSPEARDLLVNKHDWPGNFRELDAVVERLPLTDRPGSIDVTTCADAVKQGMIKRPDSRAAPAWMSQAQTQVQASAPEKDAADGLLRLAAEMYRRRTGHAEPRTAADLEDLFETVVKPLFFARALGMEGIDAVPKNPTPSFRQLGKRLDSTDDTVKSQLERYVALKRQLATTGR